jgi:hypothetical protein
MSRLLGIFAIAVLVVIVVAVALVQYTIWRNVD